MRRRIVGPAGIALVACAGSGAAQGIALFGDARLGLGYNIDNDGEPTGDEQVRVISRIRFGVNMTGETESGIVYGGEIQADNAPGGEGGPGGQTEGSVFVSGAFGTLSVGDTDGADAVHVGDLEEVGLTCLACQNETPFISNGGSFGDDPLNFAENPRARPTIRYDYDVAGFGLSLSSNRELDDIGVGASWTGDFDGGSVTIGGGYYNFSAFRSIDDGGATVPAGEQWSAAIGGEFGRYSGKAIYSSADSDGDAGFETLGAGFEAGFGAWEVNVYYISIIDAFGTLGSFDGEDSTGLGASYELGGGAEAKFGVAYTYADATLADFGIELAF